MSRFRSVFVLVVTLSLVVCVATCSSPTWPALPVLPPPPAPTEFVGEWAGTNTHGAPVNFSVTDDQVTSFTLSLDLPPNCSSTETVTGPVRIALRPDNQQGFLLSKVYGDWEWGIALYGVFAADRKSASGEIQLVQHPSCGTIPLKWSATRR